MAPDRPAPRPRRRTAPRVVDGRVQRKNDWSLTVDWTQTEIDGLRFARERPGAGYRHYVRRRDLERFVRLLPRWDELSEGLDAVLLAEADDDALGWHSPGIVAVCAWPKELEASWTREFFDEHAAVMGRIDVEVTGIDDDSVHLRFTESSVQAFQLMHVLLHELGHHHDRMTTRSRQRAARGEAFAESYALEHAERLWEAYYAEFPY